MVKVTSEDIEVQKIVEIKADFGELRVHMKDGGVVVFTLETTIENRKELLAELDMVLSKDYGIGLDLNKYPAISKLIEELKKY